MLAEEYVSTQHYFATMMLDCGDVDALISGTRSSYKMAIKPLLQVIGVKKDMALAGVYMMVKEQSISFFADCTVHIDPSAEQLAEIALTTHKASFLVYKRSSKGCNVKFCKFWGEPLL